MSKKVSIFWFRRDLRVDDNRGFFEALNSNNLVLPIFIFDSNILKELPSKDHRVEYIHNSVDSLHKNLQKFDSGLAMYHGDPYQIFQNLIKDFDITSIYVNSDYEPYAKKRDSQIQELLHQHDIDFFSYKDQVIFEKDDIVKNDGTPYVVYTPYMKKWMAQLNTKQDLKECKPNPSNLIQLQNFPYLSLNDINFTQSGISMPEFNIDSDLINNYGEYRDFPGLSATSHVGTALRFGVISIRKIVAKALLSSDKTYLKELIWRDFFMQILWHFPYTQHQSFKEKYDSIPWRDAPNDLEKWKKGQTGYPIVDAGMRELNTTGYMHNRVRMITASFLCKHLLIDWREGEKYFAEKLYDYELASNVGNWQWVAGSGVDAAPYFRIFNPETQMKKFDPKGEYVKKWVPEYFGVGYVLPMVDHKFARERAIETYKTALDNFEK